MQQAAELRPVLPPFRPPGPAPAGRCRDPAKLVHDAAAGSAFARPRWARERLRPTPATGAWCPGPAPVSHRGCVSAAQEYAGVAVAQEASCSAALQKQRVAGGMTRTA